MATHEREINEPVDLCLPDGRLNPAARGWSRKPLHRANLRRWGRTKRATGTVRIGDRVLESDDDAWAVLDHGRGRWPRSVGWNRGAASGRTDGHTVGLRFGGRWTSGTGATENALCLDGRLTKIGEELEWRWSPADFMTPWTITSSGERPAVGLIFAPFHNRSTRTEAGLIANRTDQCFGHDSGRVRDDESREIVVDRLLGWAEDVHMRW
ncbi:DUF2804 domain-containing protein [Streptomyces sp. NPDC058092]|uniref:DUF2804 domain-containing protein n=1 Tax=Streptomyces sp. NPDC058092 TaxID=3346336 RepID=UPI0036E33F9D